MCLLAMIAEEPSYGYEMARKLENRGLSLVTDLAPFDIMTMDCHPPLPQCARWMPRHCPCSFPDMMLSHNMSDSYEVCADATMWKGACVVQ